jgi:hypothetical protein
LLREAEEALGRTRDPKEIVDMLHVIEKAASHFYLRAEMGKHSGTRKPKEIDEDYREAAALASLAAPYRHARLSAMKLAGDPSNQREEMMTVNRIIMTSLLAAGFVLSRGTAFAAGQYGPGVSDTEIKIGNTMPYSGVGSFHLLAPLETNSCDVADSSTVYGTVRHRPWWPCSGRAATTSPAKTL